MNKQSNDTRTPPLLHAARLVFPPLAALVVLVLTEWIARGTLDADTFAQYIEPHWEAYALAWALLFLVWLTVDWLTRFAAAGHAGHSHSGLRARGGRFLHPPAAG